MPPKGAKGKGKQQTRPTETGKEYSKPTFVDQLKNGAALCKEFNQGKCFDKNCTKGKHLCNVAPYPGGKPCGGAHPGYKCNKLKKSQQWYGSPAQDTPGLGIGEWPCTGGEAGRPRALDVCAGVNCPLARALVWCGWDVIPIDIALNPQHDVQR